jgi:colanic acid biosynthesis glycosyl transferase WcaI
MLAAAPVVARLAVWADVWFVVTPAFGSAVLGALLARALKARVHLHVQDVVPDVAIESGQLGSRLGRALATGVAHWTYGSFRSISVLSESMAARVRRYGKGVARADLVAPNWVRDGAPSATMPPEPLTGRAYGLYAGSFGGKQDLSTIIEAARLLSMRGGPAIAVLGDGPGRQVVEDAAGQLVWLGLVDDATYANVLHHALAGIVALAQGVGDSVVPSKLAAYLGAGRPVIVAADPESEAARVVAQADCGLRIPPGRADLLADALCLLAGDHARWQRFAGSGLAYAKAHWQKETIVGRIEAALVALSS